MKFLVRCAAPLLAGLAFAPVAVAGAETPGRFDLGPGVSDYRRFLVYPHLQKGFAAQAAGRRKTALAEFARAREILPDNAVVALSYARALAQFGDSAGARRVLEAQLRLTPDDAALKEALAGLAPVPAPVRPVVATAPSAPVAAPPAAPALAAPARAAPVASATTSTAVTSVAVVANAAPAPARTPAPLPGAGRAASVSAARASATSTPGATTVAAPEGAAAAAPLPAGQASTAVTPALAAAPPASAAATAAAELDVRSYRLLTAGARADALHLLLQSYPFAGADPALRLLLLQRIGLLAGDPALLDAPARARLAAPLETPVLRGAQAQVFTQLKDCVAVRELLGDLAPEYGRDDWMRLGDCYRDTQPGLAQHAYAAAWKRQPDGETARALAYQAFANRDYPAALAAWKSLTPENLASDDLMAGVTTALSAGDSVFAEEWLAVQARRFGSDSETYWWRRAQALSARDPVQAEAAVREALARQPRLDYYRLLASLQQRAGATDAAIATLRTALSAEPGNPDLQLQLAYACERAGRLGEARALFEAARTASPDNRQVTEQLVYLAERQGDLAAARDHAAAAIDQRLATPPADIAEDAAAADTLFGLRRLHEDLGRRWNLNADLFTGAGLVSAANAPAGGTTYRSYMQLEAEYRLEGAPLPPRLLAPYVRVFAGSGEEDSALPVYSPMLGAGLRLRPWRRQNVAFALEQQLPLDKGPDVQADVMVRASGSWLDSGRFSGDWHAAGSGWTSQSLYLDLARFLDARRSAATADYRLAWQHKTGNGRTLEPYGHLQYNVSDAATRDEDVRGGLGLRWNRWFGESVHDAWRHKASIGLEYQHAIHSWLADRDSLSLNLGLHW